jgi:hypothetical protein
VCPEPVFVNVNCISIHRDSSEDNPRNSSAVPTLHPVFSNIFRFAFFIMTFPLPVALPENVGAFASRFSPLALLFRKQFG